MRTMQALKKLRVSLSVGILLVGTLAFSLPFFLSQSSHKASATSALPAPSVTVFPFAPFTLSSPDVHDGGFLSLKNENGMGRCLGIGQNVAPTLDWKYVPVGTQSFVLLMSDPDAARIGGFHHWVVYNIPGNVTHMEGNAPFTGGLNDYALTGYDGPCPPPTGQTHHYTFQLYAISLPQVGPSGLTFGQVTTMIQNSILGATVMVTEYRLPL